MIKSLYIIGNGFDLNHGLPTSYGNFRDSCVRKNRILWGSLKTIYGDVIEDDMWWWDFEQMLGKIDYNHLFQSNNGMALSSNKVKNLLEGALPPFFGKWIMEVDTKLTTVSPKPELSIDTDSQFFTFNYTSVLEKVYKVSSNNVWHIHGSVSDFEKGGNPVVGHDNDERKMFCLSQKYKENHQISRIDLVDSVNQSAAKGSKGVEIRISQNEDEFYERYAGITQFVAMGFSFNEIDMPYIKKMIDVNRTKSNTIWKIYWYAEGEVEKFKERLSEIGISESQISFQKW